jgi:hypothetical protein
MALARPAPSRWLRLVAEPFSKLLLKRLLVALLLGFCCLCYGQH